MHKLLLDLPTQLETERLILRPYRAGDGAMYYQAGQRNREHLRRFESGNAILNIRSEEEGEILVRELALDWAARHCFFWGVFEKTSGEFAGQIYIGPVRWETPEFEIGYFADCQHEGKGYITEAVRAALRFIFENLQAHRASLHCCDQNLRSLRIAERCGFVLEGHTREDFPNPYGGLDSSLHYGLLRSDWEKIAAEQPAP